MNEGGSEGSTTHGSPKDKVLWVPEGSCCVKDICDVRTSNALSVLFRQQGAGEEEEWTAALGFVLMHGSWCRLDGRKNKKKIDDRHRQRRRLLTDLAEGLTRGLSGGERGRSCRIFATSVQVDDCDDSQSLLIGDNDDDHDTKNDKNSRRRSKLPIPPGELPCLAVVFQTSDMEHSDLRYVSKVSPSDLASAATSDVAAEARNRILKAAKATVVGVENDYDLPVSPESCADAIRIFVAGDRSSVGKSSVCLGIVGDLLSRRGYGPEDLAYIKPATQSESPQLIQRYCERHGVDCVPIGPLVYYRGFTRAFLSGEAGTTSQELLDTCGSAVDRLARGKKVVLIDGVGFPAVGSICGTDNASVARSCGYPATSGRRSQPGVILVGGSGVGAAVDAFNLNATYFENAGVPVMGAIFNKLSVEGYYSLENCKREVTKYFEQNDQQVQRNRRAFGFLPLFPDIADKANGMECVDEFIRTFGERVDVGAILAAAVAVKASPPPRAGISGNPPSTISKNTSNGDGHRAAAPPPKRRKVLSHQQQPARARDAIEQEAILAGAAPSA